eukprot:CAMPEP_0183576334 /NCGR_PEP_ID=MMETSP0371-20130417/137436_1 /TAXON_ID=268820 /ORGANISM="Peridinium aciculiferum, Strain PAER-2" /LENGTH=126 /DNA_ID=CAMNT_0025786571 /DNA_START=80 /DNA_END=456 /DNA_ORIENTATION=+
MECSTDSTSQTKGAPSLNGNENQNESSQALSGNCPRSCDDADTDPTMAESGACKPDAVREGEDGILALSFDFGVVGLFAMLQPDHRMPLQQAAPARLQALNGHRPHLEHLRRRDRRAALLHGRRPP